MRCCCRYHISKPSKPPFLGHNPSFYCTLSPFVRIVASLPIILQPLTWFLSSRRCRESDREGGHSEQPMVEGGLRPPSRPKMTFETSQTTVHRTTVRQPIHGFVHKRFIRDVLMRQTLALNPCGVAEVTSDRIHKVPLTVVCCCIVRSFYKPRLNISRIHDITTYARALVNDTGNILYQYT